MAAFHDATGCNGSTTVSDLPLKQTLARTSAKGKDHRQKSARCGHSPPAEASVQIASLFSPTWYSRAGLCGLEDENEGVRGENSCGQRPCARIANDSDL